MIDLYLIELMNIRVMNNDKMKEIFLLNINIISYDDDRTSDLINDDDDNYYIDCDDDDNDN